MHLLFIYLFNIEVAILHVLTCPRDKNFNQTVLQKNKITISFRNVFIFCLQSTGCVGSCLLNVYLHSCKAFSQLILKNLCWQCHKVNIIIELYNWPIKLITFFAFVCGSFVVYCCDGFAYCRFQKLFMHSFVILLLFFYYIIFFANQLDNTMTKFIYFYWHGKVLQVSR